MGSAVVLTGASLEVDMVQLARTGGFGQDLGRLFDLVYDTAQCGVTGGGRLDDLEQRPGSSHHLRRKRGES
jgi:hypothetical protein